MADACDICLHYWNRRALGSDCGCGDIFFTGLNSLSTTANHAHDIEEDMDEPQDTPAVHTYHCICTQLLLATTLDLQRLPRRANPAIDKAIILPIASSSEDDDEYANDQQVAEAGSKNASANYGHSELVSIVPERRPTIIRRSDGFEKRMMLRCGRCRLVVGYTLDDEQFNGKVSLKTSEGKEFEIVYLIPGALIATEGMKRGEVPVKERWETATA